VVGYREKPKGDQIRVSLDSGANIHSRNDLILTASDLGFESKAEWDSLGDDAKSEAVKEYFYTQGWPEWSWDDAESAAE
jgi:hypothetical protein